MLKSYEITKPCYHADDLEGDNVRRLIAKGIIVFEETRRHLTTNKPDAINDQEINSHFNDFAKLSSLMENTFSTLHSKRADATIDKTTMLETYLNLVRIKWKA